MVAVSLWRCCRHHRTPALAEPRTLHDHRRDAARISRPRRGPCVRRHGAARHHRPVSRRPGERPRLAFVVVARHHAAPQAGRDHRPGHSRVARVAAADPRGHDAPGLAGSGPGLLPARRVQAGRRRSRTVGAPEGVRAAVADPDGGGGPRAVHCMRKHRQPAARPRHSAAARADDAPGSRSVGIPSGAAVARGESAALRRRCGHRPRLRPVGYEPAGRPAVHVPRGRDSRCASRLARAGASRRESRS